MDKKIIRTNNIEIVLNENPYILDSIFILPNRTKVCANGFQSFTLRSPKSLSDPVFLTEFVGLEYSGNNGLIYNFSDRSGDNSLYFHIAPQNECINITYQVESSEPIWLFEWKISGLLFDEVVVPALGGQALSNNMPEGTTVSYKFPFWWNSQFVIGKVKQDCLLFSSRDSDDSLKLLRVGKESETFAITLGLESKAPINNNKLTANLYLQSFTSGWKSAVDYHRIWMETEYDLVDYRQHASYPKWANAINFVLEFWGARKGIRPGHTFQQMRVRLNEWKKHHSPSNTLVYIAGFAENGIDSHAPDYNPSESCGGKKEFELLINEAHTLGYRVMIHTNVLAMTFTHRLYSEFKKFQVIDAFGREQGWGMDMDGDWLAEPYFAYINPGYEEWGDHMEQTIRELINSYNVDAVFLDQTLLAFNVSKGPNFQSGMRNHIARLQKAFPGILFAGEGLHEFVLSVLPFVQIHGIDSITEVHGMEGQLNWRKVHPVSTYLFGKYARFTGHLLTKHPSHPMFSSQEEAYSKLGVIPVLSLYDNEQKMELPEVHKMIERAKTNN